MRCSRLISLCVMALAGCASREQVCGEPAALRDGTPQAMEAVPPMKIEVLGFESCPNTPRMRANVEKAVTSMGLAANVLYVDQEKLPENDRRRGWPSPTVLVDGRDLFGMTPPQEGDSMSCRTYSDGGARNEAEIAAALKSMMARSPT